MNNLLTKAIKKEPITDKEMAEELFEICDREHAGCNSNCPIFEIVLSEKQKQESDCPYFKNGTKMLKAIKEKIK